jgi:hypothetical protein
LFTHVYECGGQACVPPPDTRPHSGDAPDDVASDDDHDESQEVHEEHDEEAWPFVFRVLRRVGHVRHPERDAGETSVSKRCSRKGNWELSAANAQERDREENLEGENQEETHGGVDQRRVEGSRRRGFVVHEEDDVGINEEQQEQPCEDGRDKEELHNLWRAQT